MRSVFIVQFPSFTFGVLVPYNPKLQRAWKIMNPGDRG